VRAARLVLAAVAAAPVATAQERPRPETPVLEWAPDAVAGMPGLEGERGRAVSAALGRRAYDEAERLLVEAAQGRNVTAELLRLLGSVSFLNGHYLNTAIALKKAEALAPLDERSRFTLAMSYVVLGQRDWARPELQKLARAAPGNPLYRYWMARLDYDTGRYAEAVAGFLDVLATDARYVKAHDNLGLSYDALGRDEEAEKSYQTAVRLNRESASPSPWPPHNLGLLLTRLNRAAEAEPLFREALRHDAGFAPAHYQLGVTLEKTGRPEDAIAELQEAARLDPAYPDPQYALARLFRRLGRSADADRALEDFRRLKSEQRKTPAR
jgi:tetratricopeptide (TPR) repeat protein